MATGLEGAWLGEGAWRASGSGSGGGGGGTRRGCPRGTRQPRRQPRGGPRRWGGRFPPAPAAGGGPAPRPPSVAPAPSPAPPAAADVFVTARTDFRAQLRRCQRLLAPGGAGGARGGPLVSPPGELRLHGLGLAVPRTINLALQLQAGAPGALRLHASTSSVTLPPLAAPRRRRGPPPPRGGALRRRGRRWRTRMRKKKGKGRLPGPAITRPSTSGFAERLPALEGGAPRGFGGAPRGIEGAPRGVGGAPRGVGGAPQGVG
ncbi:LOW QUALITY PROTEIN: ribonuclease P protein subunit p20 [Phalacrocorax carbo]|uniref:LOW QUALITY PROTEIN: ribonuclease P protein subunit p20 n=1 Tax=Phalacrocorax carbo TaxID=9209 RepID=UPI00311941CA